MILHITIPPTFINIMWVLYDGVFQIELTKKEEHTAHIYVKI